MGESGDGAMVESIKSFVMSSNRAMLILVDDDVLKLGVP